MKGVAYYCAQRPRQFANTTGSFGLSGVALSAIATSRRNCITRRMFSFFMGRSMDISSRADDRAFPGGDAAASYEHQGR
jgi:hypothetical protein